VLCHGVGFPELDLQSANGTDGRHYNFYGRPDRDKEDQCCACSQSRAVSANLSNAVTLCFAATEVMT
jgi:hypothetical protein